jgi:hypothetical protein
MTLTDEEAAITALRAQLTTSQQEVVHLKEHVTSLNMEVLDGMSRESEWAGAVHSLFDVIKHGDEKHQEWLKAMIDKHFEGIKRK